MSFRNILIVDANQEAARQLSRGLRLLGYHVETVPTGRAALALASSGDFDVGLFSESLPDGDGVEVFRSLTTCQRRMRGVLLAAVGNLITVWKAMEAGMNRVLLQPVDFAELLPLVEAETPPGEEELPAAPFPPTFDEAAIAALTSETIRHVLTRDELIEIIRSVEYPFAGKERLPNFDRDTLERLVHLVRRWCQARCVPLLA